MDLILTVSVSLAVALVLGYVTQRLGLSPLVGYLLAGVIVGPSTPGFIANHEIAAQLAENGVTCTIIEMNLETVHRLRTQGITAVYGDAGHHDTLRSAGVDRARCAKREPTSSFRVKARWHSP